MAMKERFTARCTTALRSNPVHRGGLVSSSSSFLSSISTFLEYMIHLRINGKHSLLTSLPSELILQICYSLDRKDLPAFARISRTTYAIAVTLLYRHITLTNSSAAYYCLASLAYSPQARDLAKYVFTFALESFVPWNFGQEQAVYFRTALNISVRRMVNIRSFRCMLGGYFGDDVAYELLPHANTLTSLSVSLPVVPPWMEANLPAWRRSGLTMRLPKLNTFEFEYAADRPPMCPMYDRFVRHILTAHACQLKSLKFPPWFTSEYFLDIVPQPVTFPCLESITLQASTISASVSTKIVTATSLTFPSFQPLIRPALPHFAFPNLTYFSGSCRVFPDILSASAHRPIQTVQFDGAMLDMDDTAVLADPVQPKWSHALRAFRQFVYSSSQVKELSFYVQSLDAVALRKCLPFWGTLERVTICLRSDLKNFKKLLSLGKHLLASMPSLHTFYLSDEPFYVHRNKRFSFAHDHAFHLAVLDRWTKACPTLKRVSFTALRVWVRVASSSAGVIADRKGKGKEREGAGDAGWKWILDDPPRRASLGGLVMGRVKA
ncbi:hypothetical protein BXZ70DRAFT_445080 [Cristinia sonorae]|uniref:F-box domain-containing protein n=1 Tax=Cristinia sonorae TaxID=1940300 RepID=A0A8K0UJ59_9AGAR|nr:hypothetical protein BXZ70DRAFT_445080 [Cristinia sonorae]